ncbi:MAG TPA: cyclic pyranopterin monophosphate synthase MoaC [Thermoplasmata archaeon]|nr:cyclic pyranopterin monophosphate synthase MoaC [Thermoplasmata archaeon]
MVRQKDVAAKPRVHRRAVVEGWLAIAPSTRRAIRAHRVEKGDPISAGELAGLLAMKRTPDLIPHCHPVALTASAVELSVGARGVRVRATAEAFDRTGVEMEALVGASIALLTVWDMVKYLEKDDRGLYPRTSLGPIRVTAKVKGAPDTR